MRAMQAGVEIDALLDAVPGWAGRPRLVEPLDGGITNRNYKVALGTEVLVVRVSGANTDGLGIDREVEYESSLLAAAAGIGPEVVAFLRYQGILVTRFIDGAPVPEPEVHQAPTLRRIADSLLKVHRAGQVSRVFSPFSEVERSERRARERGVPVPEAYQRADIMAREIQSALPATPPCLCHNDLNNANFIDDGTTIRIVDWEYAGMGDRYFDLGSLASEHQLLEAEEWTLLGAYFERPTAADHARLRLMNLMADLDSAVWAILQQGISPLDFDYKGFAAEYFGRLLSAAADPRYRSWLRDCAG